MSRPLHASRYLRLEWEKAIRAYRELQELRKKTPFVLSEEEHLDALVRAHESLLGAVAVLSALRQCSSTEQKMLEADPNSWNLEITNTLLAVEQAAEALAAYPMPLNAGSKMWEKFFLLVVCLQHNDTGHTNYAAELAQMSQFSSAWWIERACRFMASGLPLATRV